MDTSPLDPLTDGFSTSIETRNCFKTPAVCRVLLWSEHLHLSGSVELRAVGTAVQPRFAPFLKSIQRTCLDPCQFGTPWQKRTAVLPSLVDTHALARICTSQTVCSWSHRPRVHLGSVNANGISMARLSAPLPDIICKCAVCILQNAYRAQQAAAVAPILVFLMFAGRCMFLAI